MSDALGTLLVLSGCFLAAAGYVLQKKGNVAWAAEPAAIRKPIYCNRLWLLGLVCMVVSAGLVVASAPFLDQSKSAPLGAATLVFNTILSTLFLGEKFLLLHLFSTILIVTGAVLASSANTAPSADLSYWSILGLFDGVAIGFSVFCALAVGASLYVLRRITQAPRGEWSARDATTLSLLAPALGGCCNGFVSYATKVVTTAMGKGDASALASPPLWAFLALLIAAVLGQVRFLNLGLSYFSAMQIVPMFQCAIILSNSVCGIVYFSDMRESPPSLALFFLGAAICAGGILLLLLNKEEGAAGGMGASETLIEQPPAAAAAGAATAVGLEAGADPLHAARAVSAGGKHSAPWPEPTADADIASLTAEHGAAQPVWYLREVRSFLPGAGRAAQGQAPH